MRKQPRSAAVFITVLLATGVATIQGAFAPAALGIGEDRTDSETYTESRADYWEARAGYEARKAATQARKAGLAVEESSDDTGGGDGGYWAEAAAPAATSAAAPAPRVSAWGPTAAQLAALRMCESTDDYTANTGNGYYGAYQFSPVTWWWLGYSGWPHLASPAVQDQAVRDLWEIMGWSPWPACARYLGFL